MSKVKKHPFSKDKGIICPRCKKRKLYDKEIMNKLSRRDNKTYICSDCGTEEAFFDSLNRKRGFTAEEIKKERAWLKEQIKG